MRLPDQRPNSGALDRWIKSSLFKSTTKIYFVNWPSGISILKPHLPLSKTSRVEDLMTRGILDLDDQDPLQVFGTLGKSKLKSGLLLHVLLPRVVDLMTRGSG
jgi:hypothetical protein